MNVNNTQNEVTYRYQHHERCYKDGYVSMNSRNWRASI